VKTPTAPSPADRSTRWAPLILLGLTALAALRRLPARGLEGLWFDEVFTVVLAAQDLPELLRRALADETNPPGFYLLTWLWARLGGFDLVWLRTLPALAGILAVPATALFARRLGSSWRSALLAAAAIDASPLMLAMSLEVRAYALLALLAAWSSSLVLAPRTRPRAQAITLAATQVALVALHYFGALVVLGQCVAVFWTDRARLGATIRAALPAALVTMAWIAVVVASSTDASVGSNASWIVPPDLARLRGFAPSVLGTLGSPGGAMVAMGLLAAAILLAGRRALGTDDAATRARWLLAVGVLPLAIVFVASTVGPRSLWVPRYLIIALPALCVLVAELPELLARHARLARLARLAAVTALATWLLLAGTHDAAARPQKPDWAVIVRTMAGTRPAVVCVNEAYVALPLRYHAVSERLPLTVLDFAECAAQGRGDWAVLRAETITSIPQLIAAQAMVGAGRPLTDARPVLAIRWLRWPGAERR